LSSIARVSGSIPPGAARHVADLAGEEHEAVRLDDLRERQIARFESRRVWDGLGHRAILQRMVERLG
jgi:hypothetical protein